MEPIDYCILIGAGIIILLNIYAITRCTVQRVAKFYLALQVVHLVNILWQICTCLANYWPGMVPVSMVIIYTIVAVVNMAATSIFHLMVLDAFKVLTRIPSSFIMGVKGWMLFLMVMASIFGSIIEVTPTPMTVTIFPILLLLMAATALCSNGLKSIYLLRLLYLDKLRTDKNNTDKAKTTNKYQSLQIMLVTIIAFNLVTVVIWQTGTIYGVRAMIHGSVLLAGIEVLYYANLICCFRDIRFDQQVVKGKADKAKPRPSDTLK